MAKPDKEVAELELLMRLTSVSAAEAARRAGNMAPSNWSRWFNLGMSPTLSKFSKFRAAVIDLGVERGVLPQGAHNRTVPELIELAKGWRV
jgi:hypothetical protein